jgi:hypothetical protein
MASKLNYFKDANVNNSFSHVILCVCMINLGENISWSNPYHQQFILAGKSSLVLLFMTLSGHEATIYKSSILAYFQSSMMPCINY